MTSKVQAIMAGLSDTDKARVIAMFCQLDASNTNWEQAAEAYGSASLNGFKVCCAETRKKIRRLMDSDDSTTTTPVSTPKKNARKRKADNDVNGTSETAPSPAPRGRPKKAKKAPSDVVATPIDETPAPVNDRTEKAAEERPNSVLPDGGKDEVAELLDVMCEDRGVTTVKEEDLFR